MKARCPCPRRSRVVGLCWFSVSLSVHLFVFVGWVWAVLSRHGIFFIYSLIYLCGLGVRNTTKACFFHFFLYIFIYLCGLGVGNTMVCFFPFLSLLIYLCGLGVCNTMEACFFISLFIHLFIYVGNTIKACFFSISLSIHLFIYVDWVWVIL